MTKRIFILLLIISPTLIFSQKKLRVGERIPFSRVDVFNENNKKTGIDLPNGKNTTDRFVLVLFYTPQQSVKHLVEINQKIEQILNRFQNNACKGASEIEYVTICAENKPEVWQAYLNEGNLKHSKFTGKKTNYLAKDGLKEMR
jgi:hypothetical protein